MIAGMIIASGKTSLHEGPSPYKDVGGISAIQHMILAMQLAGIDRVFLVTSQDADRLVKHVTHMDTTCIYNDEPGAEMLHNVQYGIRNLPEAVERVVISPADYPFFTARTIDALMNSDSQVAVPVYNGVTGHPIAVSATWFENILKADTTLKELLQKHENSIEKIAVNDKGIAHNTRYDDSNQDTYLLNQHEVNTLRPVIKLSIAKQDAFYGPGTQLLMQLTHEKSSLHMACRNMGISYSKGWKMIINLERQLGYQVMVRQQGGKGGGASKLTEQGLEFVGKYSLFTAKSKEIITQLFDEIFG